MHGDPKNNEFFVESGQEAQLSYSAIAATATKIGAITTLNTISYLAGSAIQSVDMVTAELIPGFLRIPSVPSWVPIESIGILSTISPLLTLGADLRKLDPTGLSEMYSIFNLAKTSLNCTKIAADIAVTAIETGNVKETVVSGAQSIAKSYVPASVRDMLGAALGIK